MEELSARHRHLKLKGNKEANLIAIGASLKVQEANKIRELYRVIFEITEKAIEGIRKKQEIEIEWELLGEVRR